MEQEGKQEDNQVTNLEKIRQDAWKRVVEATEQYEMKGSGFCSRHAIPTALTPYLTLDVVERVSGAGAECRLRYSFDEIPGKVMLRAMEEIDSDSFRFLKSTGLLSDWSEETYNLDDDFTRAETRSFEGSGLDDITKHLQDTNRGVKRWRSLVIPDLAALSLLVNEDNREVFHRYVTATRTVTATETEDTDSLYANKEGEATPEKPACTESSKYLIVVKSSPINVDITSENKQRTKHPYVSELSIPSSKEIFGTAKMGQYIKNLSADREKILEVLAEFNEMKAKISNYRQLERSGQYNLGEYNLRKNAAKAVLDLLGGHYAT